MAMTQVGTRLINKSTELCLCCLFPRQVKVKTNRKPQYWTTKLTWFQLVSAHSLLWTTKILKTDQKVHHFDMDLTDSLEQLSAPYVNILKRIFTSYILWRQISLSGEFWRKKDLERWKSWVGFGPHVLTVPDKPQPEEMCLFLVGYK